MTRPHPNATHLIAIVENDGAARHSFEVLLKSEGYRVSAFESGRRFLEAFEALGPCCVLLEMRLPDIDGLEVLEAVRRSPASPPVILMTRVPKLPVPERVRRMGAMMLLEKPIEHACLFSAIRMAVDGHAGGGPERR